MAAVAKVDHTDAAHFWMNSPSTAPLSQTRNVGWLVVHIICVA